MRTAKRKQRPQQKAVREKALVLTVRSTLAKYFAPITTHNRALSYVGYFENSNNEQFIVEIDRRTKTGLLRPVDGSPPVQLANNAIEGSAVLSHEEFAWLTACWRAATGEDLRPTECSEPLWQEAIRQRQL